MVLLETNSDLTECLIILLSTLRAADFWLDCKFDGFDDYYKLCKQIYHMVVQLCY